MSKQLVTPPDTGDNVAQEIEIFTFHRHKDNNWGHWSEGNPIGKREKKE